MNFCAPVAEGAFDLDVRLVKANRSSQHWCVEMTQGGGDVATLATAVFAERRPSWSHQQAKFPDAVPFEQARAFPNTPMTWTHQYDFRFVEGEPSFYGSPASSPLDALSKQWIGDHMPRKIDMLSLMSMSDAFFGRVFLARRELIPFGTVSITTYFHTASDELAAEDITHVLAVADARISTEVTATSTANCGRRRDGCSRPRRRSPISRRDGVGGKAQSAVHILPDLILGAA